MLKENFPDRGLAFHGALDPRKSYCPLLLRFAVAVRALDLIEEVYVLVDLVYLDIETIYDLVELVVADFLAPDADLHHRFLRFHSTLRSRLPV